MKIKFDIFQEKWVKLLICFGMIPIYPILFFFIDHDIESLEISIVMFIAYYLGIYISALCILDAPIESLYAGNGRNKLGRGYILVNALLLTSIPIFFYCMGTETKESGTIEASPVGRISAA